MKNGTTRLPRPIDPAEAARAKLDAKRAAARDPYAIGRASVHPLRAHTTEHCLRCGGVTATLHEGLCRVCQSEKFAQEPPSPEAIADLLAHDGPAPDEETPEPEGPSAAPLPPILGPSILCCAQFHPITMIPFACPTCGKHLVGEQPPTLQALVQQELVTLDAAIATIQAQYEALMRTITRQREQRSLLEQYLALVTEED